MMERRKSMRRLVLLGSFVLSCPLQFCAAYRIGDTVGTLIRTPRGTSEALISQMPLFGYSTDVVFTDESPTSFSVAFEEGIHTLPWIELYDSRRHRLDVVEVTFVYSRSGDGTIHAISSEAKYKDAGDEVDGFRVRYKWVEEEEVDLVSGSAVMLLAVSIAALIMMLQTCGETSRPSASVHRDNHHHLAMGVSSASSYDYGEQTSVAIGGKWD
jgi:hypothetical protein